MLVGNEKTVALLKQLADSGDLAQGYILWGPERVGKQTIVRTLAGYFEGKGEADNNKLLCIDSSVPLFDYKVISPANGKSIGIDAVREISEFLRKKPFKSRYRIAAVDDAHFMTTEAQNALLKITEDTPPSGVIFLIMRHPEEIRSTLSSRLQKLYFAPIAEKEIERWLIGEFNCAKGEANVIAQQSFGQPGRAYALLYDDEFKKLQKRAGKFLSSGVRERRAFIKEFMAEDDFNFKKFLDALIEGLVLNYLKKERTERALYADDWHTLLLLRNNAEFFNINPRLQLETLARML